MKKIDREDLLEIIRGYGWDVDVQPYGGHEYAVCNLPSSVAQSYTITLLVDTTIDLRDGLDDAAYELKVDEYVSAWKTARNYYGMPGIPDVDEIEKEGNRIHDILKNMLNDVDDLLKLPKNKVFGCVER